MSSTPADDAIYLDHSSTTFMLPVVQQRLMECLQIGLANPASQHAAGRHARQLLEAAKRSVSKALGGRLTGQDRDRLIITSGGTESNNLALRGLAGTPDQDVEILISAVEHPSALGAGEWLTRAGFRVHSIPVDANGVVTPETLTRMISDKTRLVSVMAGNNETGVLQPLAELASVCHKYGAMFHTDAVQAVGKQRLSFAELGVDALTVSAHKFHGPRGIGALLIRDRCPLQPLLIGGGQQLGLRPGTEPVASVCAMACALEVVLQDPDPGHKVRALRNKFESLMMHVIPDVVIHGQNVSRLPHISNISFVGYDRQALLMALDRTGIACSSGSACASGSSEPSHVLRAMGCEERLVESALRFSFGITNLGAEIQTAVDRIAGVLARQKMASK